MKVSKLILFIIFFLLISTAAWASSPVIFYSDLTAGPNTGGQNNNGVFVTIWGNNFGSSQGSSYVTVGSGKVNNYPTWTNTMICFQLGSLATTGNIVVTSSNGTSNGLAFTVQSGNIYFVQPGASTNGTGTYASPFNHLWYAYNILNAGDTVYVETGTIYDEVDGQSEWHSILAAANSGTQGHPISWIAYPNDTVTLEADGGTDTWVDGSSSSDSDVVQYIFRSSGASWTTIAKFYLVIGGTTGIAAVASSGYDGWKIVGNNATATAWPDDGIITFSNNYSQVLGNQIYNSGSLMGAYNNEAHDIYWNAGGTNVIIAWNWIHDNELQGWGIDLFHQGSTAEPTRVGVIHDNLITNAAGNQMKGILVGDVDTGENEADVEGQNIEVYNNVLYDVGIPEYGGAIQCVSGTGYIYNNTIYESPETYGTLQFPSTGIGPGGGLPVWYVANNIIVNSASTLYISNQDDAAPNWAMFALLTNNNYYGTGNGPSEDAHPMNANPQFVAAGTNFELQATSPDINAGYNTTSIVAQDFNGLLRSSAPSIGAYEYTSAVPSPVVAITSPATGINVSTGSNVSITATASESNGTITNISLYSGSTLLGSSSSSPYTYTMTDPAIATYTLTAVATDAKGVSTTSSPVIVIVIPLSLPSSPVVNITSPASGSSYTAGSNVTITTTASETNGTISNISLYNGSGILLGTSTTSPYNYVDSNMAAGGYSFYAVAKDVNGISTTSSTITVTVTSPSSLPTVSLTAPSNNASFAAPATVFLSANASETNGTIAQVQFFNGSTLLYTDTSAPYNYTWVTSLLPGSYTLTAQATDSRGVVVTSAPVTVNIAFSLKPPPSSPVVAITSPNSGSSITAGSNLTITASASETNGSIAEVYFYNGSTFLGSSNASPYSYTWTNVPVGSYTLTAKAVDVAGVSVTSSAVTVTATSTAPSSPVVSITGPANGSSYTTGSNLTITANASDTNGTITQVQFYNGSTLLGTDTTSPYSYSWTNVLPGSYTLTAKATDANGVSTTSAPVTVTVTALPPVVSITSPANGNNFKAGSNVTITANATETNGTISEVYFYNGTAFLGSSSTSPYSYTWTNVSAGSYSLIAVAIDSKGVSTTSDAVTVTVTAPSAPVVSITSPASGSSYKTGSNITITANASETNGTIAQVQFYNGSTLLGTDTTSPYSYTWNNIPAGSYNLTAKATDTTGVSTTSSAVTITVTAPSAPVVSITSPASGSSYKTGSNITITANASETNGTIAQVQFYNGSTLLGTDTTSPYSYTWNNIPAGSYNLTAKATDTTGVSTTSSAVTITVTAPSAPVVSITGPANGSSFTTSSNITITAAASETNGSIASVKFYDNNGTSLIHTSTTSPYTYTTTAPAGTYTITAVATDANGVSTTSSPVTVTVTAAPSLPIVSITSPSNGSSFTPGSNVTITVNASETNGTITQVQIYNGTTLLYTTTSSPYNYTWAINLLPGSYNLTAQATDGRGVVVTSIPVTINVNLPGL